MTRTFRPQAILALVLSLASAMGFAQSSGQAIYKAKCADCHGATGLADTKMALALKIKPVTDPEIKRISEEVMFEDALNGIKGKMPAYKGKLTDAQIREAVLHLRSFMK